MNPRWQYDPNNITVRNEMFFPHFVMMTILEMDKQDTPYTINDIVTTVKMNGKHTTPSQIKKFLTQKNFSCVGRNLKS